VKIGTDKYVQFQYAANVSRQEPQCVSRNIFKRSKACLEAGGQHFKTLLYTTVYWNASKNRS